MKHSDYLIRAEWIKDYIAEKRFVVDILDQKFSDKYIEKFDADYIPVAYGAHKCKELGTVLSKMYKDGVLIRETRGVGCGACHDGFPKWVYAYSIK